MASSTRWTRMWVSGNFQVSTDAFDALLTDASQMIVPAVVMRRSWWYGMPMNRLRLIRRSETDVEIDQSTCFHLPQDALTNQCSF